jgi:hypothetical protein
MTRLRLWLLGICAVIFGLMSFSTSTAQAEVGAKWLFGEKSFLEAEVGAETELTLIIHFKIIVPVLIKCNVLSAKNARLKANGSIGNGAKLKFSGCVVELNGVVSSACEPKAGGTEKGVINTNAMHGLLVLHKLASGTTDNLIKITPDVGETFAVVEMGEECSIGEIIPIIGTAALKDCGGSLLTQLVKHLLEFGSKAELTELWAVSKTAEHALSILVSFWFFLTGEHTGLKFSGDPA